MELSDVGERVFAAECILSRRVIKGRVEYFIKWKGWSNKHNTWEPERNIIDKRLVKEFHEKERRKAGVVRAQKSTSKAKSIACGEKRPRGRPSVASTLTNKLKRGRPSLVTRPVKRVEAEQQNISPSSSAGKSESKRKSTVEKPTVRRKQGPRGMDRLFVKRPGLNCYENTAKGDTSQNQLITGVSPIARIEGVLKSSTHGKPEVSGNASAIQGPISGLSSLTWQPASKRVLDAVCVTDVTTCGGFTVTIRESSVVDGFFRNQDVPSDN